MCGIAGYSLSPESSVDRTLAAQALLAGIAERGADATGYAWRAGDGEIAVHKQRSGASALLDAIEIPADATQVLIHVRDYTKGHPTIEANNHPIRHGAVVGIHNGIIANDEEIFAAHGFERAAPEMTVDSEAIFALVDARPSDARVLEELRGTMASAWLDARSPRTLSLARAVGRPLWVGRERDAVFFASTRAALEILDGATRRALVKDEVEEGTLLTLVDGRIDRHAAFTPDRSYEETPLPAVRAPHEARAALRRLASIAAAL